MPISDAEEERNGDYLLVLYDGEILVDKQVFSEISPVFNIMCNNDSFRESRARRTSLQITVEDLNLLLDSALQGPTLQNNLGQLSTLIELADLYDVAIVRCNVAYRIVQLLETQPICPSIEELCKLINCIEMFGNDNVYDNSKRRLVNFLAEKSFDDLLNASLWENLSNSRLVQCVLRVAKENSVAHRFEYDGQSSTLCSIRNCKKSTGLRCNDCGVLLCVLHYKCKSVNSKVDCFED